MPDPRPIQSRACPDCESTVDRRTFLKAVGSTALVAAAAPSLIIPRVCEAAPSPTSAAETAVGRFYTSLSAEQKKRICFPFEHEYRQKISANWHVTDVNIQDDFYNDDQRKIIDEIVKNVTSEEGHKRLLDQMTMDSGSIGDFSVAMFGTPGDGKFQWELTGRHLTLRADGDSVDKAAFGGPIIYGHGEENPTENLYYYQTKQTNEVFKALDAKQMEQALVEKAPRETAVLLQGDSGKFSGIAVSELSSDQKTLVEQTLKVLLAPYRQEDVDEVMAILKETGGVDKLHMAFYKDGDLQSDKLWDMWRVEGPSFVWHFRGAPHVHAYINIGVKA